MRADDSEGTLLKRAEAVVANRCLRGPGYRSRPLDEHPRSNPASDVFGFSWSAQAARTGYVTSDEAPAGATGDDTASRPEKELLSGKLTADQGHRVPKDSCYGEAGRGWLRTPGRPGPSTNRA
ncbi:hypothetical protein JHN63_15910 [Streptomyces sp. MBT65]|uniref:hypothetical protein n=1 Tax=Streptomyces sp. MBT65 TaxID=1488395 RepID=UPI001909D07E|nr:hypothetical protein [Streptomyces sp. MBT65]MBK3575272.1 hypothetical protein [Streptomyces sp. MBT65]